MNSNQFNFNAKNSRIKIFTDFDGTITEIDSLNMILDEFAESDWRVIENRVTNHQMSEKEALQAEFDLVHISFEKALSYLQNHATIDLTFISFVNWCKSKNLELIILSGGFRQFIHSILNKFDIKDLKIYSNTINVQNGIWKVVESNLPKINNLCNHCKTNHLVKHKENGFTIVYIGDGNTDRCPAIAADIVFAKENLASYLKSINKKYYPYKNFEDIQFVLENKILKKEK